MIMISNHLSKIMIHFKMDVLYRTVTLNDATDSAKVIGKETLNMFHTMKLNISDMRGVRF